MLKIASPLLFLVLIGCSCVSTPKHLDPQNAVSANDLTALISGCGQQVTVGYLVCRLPEGPIFQKIAFHAPPELKCDENACVYFSIYFPDGRPTYEGTIKKGESYAQVPLSEIINKNAVELGDRGFYGISMTVHYKGTDGIPMKTYADGYLFLHVVRKEYTSLIENEHDENYVWEWQTKSNQTIKMTTGFRVYVSPNTSKL